MSPDAVVAEPDRGFLQRMTLATAWGEGLDGFDLGVLSVVLPLISTSLGMSPVWAGLIGASSLIGIFFGSPIVGYLTDRFGRRRLFVVDIAAFVVLGLLQGVVTAPWQLFVVRLLLGVAIGAEYAIGAAMLAEFAPSRGRGRRLSKLLVYWYVGYLVSVVVAYLLVDLVGLSWRWVLVTGAVPALVVLVLRYGLPESPRWLMLRGRTDEARAIAERYLGGEAYLRSEEFDAEKPGSGWRQLFAPRSGRARSSCARSGPAWSRRTSRSSLSRRRCLPRCSCPTRARARSRQTAWPRSGRWSGCCPSSEWAGASSSSGRSGSWQWPCSWWGCGPTPRPR
jgi:MFS family permease